MSVTIISNEALLKEDEIRLLKCLPCSFICGFTLPPRLKRKLLKLSSDMSFYELYKHFVKRPQIARDQQSISIYFIANSDYERNLLADACTRFYQNMRRSRYSIRPDSNKLAWVVPSKLLDSEAHATVGMSYTDEPKFVEILTSNTSEDVMTECEEWLPWVSLGIVTLLRRWRAPRFNAICRAMFKLAKYVDEKTGVFFPWEPNFDTDTSHIPIQALYQFENTRLMETSINVLTTLGLLSINHLRFLHPDAISLANHPKQPLLKLYAELNS